MANRLFSLMRKIAKRNGSAGYYPFTTFAEDGARYLTCDGWLSAETDDIWLFSDVSDEEACTYDIQLATYEEADGVGCSSQSNIPIEVLMGMLYGEEKQNDLRQ